MTRQASREIEIRAARWAARLDREPLSAEEQRTLDEWLAADSRHAGAFARVRGIALYTERARALGPRFDPDSFLSTSTGERPAPPHRRKLTAGLAAFAAAIVAAVFLTGNPQLDPGETYATHLGEMRAVSLADGSLMALNTSSEAVVRYTSRHREIRLLRGEGFFEVAHDPERPFEVDAGEARVRAIGTSFAVKRNEDAPVEVLVREGEVEVVATESDGVAVRVGTNMRLVAAGPVMPVPVAAAEIHRKMAWREGRIAFQGETLGEAAAQFARYSDTRIVFVDSTLANERITGLFQANDPIGFSRAVATSLGLEVELAAQEVRLRR